MASVAKHLTVANIFGYITQPPMVLHQEGDVLPLDSQIRDFIKWRYLTSCDVMAPAMCVHHQNNWHRNSITIKVHDYLVNTVYGKSKISSLH